MVTGGSDLVLRIFTRAHPLHSQGSMCDRLRLSWVSTSEPVKEKGSINAFQSYSDHNRHQKSS